MTSSEQPGTEVLEKAYSAAMALTVPVPSRDAAPHPDTCSNDDSVRAPFSLEQDQSVLSPEKMSESESSRKMPSGSSLPVNSRAPDAADELAGTVERGKGARAVEAEGLIWVDSSQQTAYSVR